MIFQTLDDKKKCVAIYNGKSLIKEFPDNLSRTWSYSAFLKEFENIQYANLYCGGKTLNEVCPEELKNSWEFINSRLRAFYSSFKEAKVSLRENCFFDLVPEKFLLEYCYQKNLITEYVLNNYEKPSDYNFLRDMTSLLTDIKYEELNINLEEVQKLDLSEKLKDKKNYINYNLFGSITGRLSVDKSSFPILNLNKSYRSIIEPKNDWFVELDMNGAELRTAFALLEKQQIVGDHHDWSVSEIFENKLNRTEAKNTAISWLYNSSGKLAIEFDNQLKKFYNKDFLKSKYYNNGTVFTPFGRKIESDDYHMINYLIQSTLIDLFHRQVIKMNKMLKNLNSKIAFLIHDCVVIDLKEEEKIYLKDFINELSNTPYGLFPINIKIGKNYGDMKKVKLKV